MINDLVYRADNTIARKLGGLEVGVFLYYVAFFLYALSVLVMTMNVVDSGYAFVGKAMTYLKLASFLLLAFKIAAFQRQDVGQWAAIALLGLLGLASYFVTDDLLMLALILFVAAAKDVDWRVLAALALAVNLMVFFMAVIGCWNGVLDDVVMSRDGVVGARHSLGFTHPNYFGLCLASCCASFFALRSKRIGIMDLFVGIVCCLVIVNVSDSRTAAVGVGLAYALFFACARVRGRVSQRILYLILTAAVAAVVVLSLYLMAAYDSSTPWQAEINQLISQRFTLAHRYFVDYPPGVLGQNTNLLPDLYSYLGNVSKTFVVDNAYARLYLRYGPVFCALVLGCLAAFFWHANKRGAYGIILAGIAFAAIYGISEHMFLRPEFNYFMVIGFSWLLYGFPEEELASVCENPAGRGLDRVGGAVGGFSGAGLSERRA